MASSGVIGSIFLREATEFCDATLFLLPLSPILLYHKTTFLSLNMHVIIIGAGPSGLAVALGFSNLGWTVDLLEKHASFDVRGSTLGLAPNGSKALAEILPEEDVSTLTDMGLSVPGFKGVSGASKSACMRIERLASSFCSTTRE